MGSEKKSLSAFRGQKDDKINSMATQNEIDEVQSLRSAGMGYADIEAAMGWPDSHGSKAWKICKGKKSRNDGCGKKKRVEGPLATLSLWKYADGGRSFRLVEDALRHHGIHCEKGEVPPFEGRYDILVPESDLGVVKALLFRKVVDFPTDVQALDNLHDVTK